MSRFLPSLLILSVLMAPLTSFAAPVSFKPVTLTQPDGSDVELFVSGDEFYHWVHDASGLPVVMDEDGWVVYVSERGDEPIPSGVPAGHPDPFLAGIDIEPGPPLTAGAIRDRIDRRRTVMSAPRTLEKRFGGPYRGTINQLVIFARFSDEPEFVDPTAVFDRMFNSDEDGVPSLDGYFNEVSYGRLRVQGHFFPSLSRVRWFHSRIHGRVLTTSRAVIAILAAMRTSRAVCCASPRCWTGQSSS